ncbi:hypothetical protein [Vibrio tritonius]|uniref:hypothetical protein n=1 Tax=Vibrio tritonius TaxID=1435069 RepID=UPI00315D3C3E
MNKKKAKENIFDYKFYLFLSMVLIVVFIILLMYSERFNLRAMSYLNEFLKEDKIFTNISSISTALVFILTYLQFKSVKTNRKDDIYFHQSKLFIDKIRQCCITYKGNNNRVRDITELFNIISNSVDGYKASLININDSNMSLLLSTEMKVVIHSEMKILCQNVDWEEILCNEFSKYEKTAFKSEMSKALEKEKGNVNNVRRQFIAIRSYISLINIINNNSKTKVIENELENNWHRLKPLYLLFIKTSLDEDIDIDFFFPALSALEKLKSDIAD